MIATVAIAPNFDLASVAEAAGQPDPEKRWYAAGILHVEGVIQAALDAAAAAPIVAVSDPVDVRLRHDPVVAALVRMLAKRFAISEAAAVAALKAELGP